MGNRYVAHASKYYGKQEKPFNYMKPWQQEKKGIMNLQGFLFFILNVPKESIMS